MQCSPKRHQLAGIIDSVEGFEKYDRGQLVMPWGTGRTLTTSWIAEAIDSRLTLVVLPSVALLQRTALTWLENRGDESRGRLLCVSAEGSVDGPARGAKSVQRTIAGLRTADEVQTLCWFLRQPGDRVVFSTYASWRAVEAALTDSPELQFDLVICDDADRCTDEQLSSLASVLDGKRIRAQRRLIVKEPGWSLTKASGVRQEDVCSSDDLFGPSFHTLSFSRALELGVFFGEPAGARPEAGLRQCHRLP